MKNQHTVPYRELRQQLLRELVLARFRKGYADMIGDTELARLYAEEERQIILELNLLRIKK